jgi:hypothetical protein
MILCTNYEASQLRNFRIPLLGFPALRPDILNTQFSNEIHVERFEVTTALLMKIKYFGYATVSKGNYLQTCHRRSPTSMQKQKTVYKVVASIALLLFSFQLFCTYILLSFVFPKYLNSTKNI